MKFVVEVSGTVYPLCEMEEAAFRKAAALDVVGMPVYSATIDGTSYFWPRPMKEFVIYKLELWPYTDSRLS